MVIKIRTAVSKAELILTHFRKLPICRRPSCRNGANFRNSTTSWFWCRSTV